MEKQIYITRKIPEAGLKLLRDVGISFDIGNSKTPPTKKEIIRALKKKPYDGVISFLTDVIDKDIFDTCPTAKFMPIILLVLIILTLMKLKKEIFVYQILQEHHQLRSQNTQSLLCLPSRLGS